VSAVWS